MPLVVTEVLREVCTPIIFLSLPSGVFDAGWEGKKIR
jgi:hypothetical protein